MPPGGTDPRDRDRGHGRDHEHEFAFELRVCQWAERHWPPAGDGDSATVPVVARQLGIRGRRWDTVVVEADREALRSRANFGERRLDSDLLDVVRHAPAEWAWYRDALPDPGYPWRYVREAVHRAAGRGVVETRRRNNRIELRRKHKYPDWVSRIVAIENKPDLDASAAAALADQLERDVDLALADEAWVATQATGHAVEPALLESLPVEAGILVVDPPESGEVAWHPRTLAVDEPGTLPGGDTADPAWKADKRLAIAERAYERGWRAYADTMRPDCRHFQLRRDRGQVPHCAAKGRCQTVGECSGSCPEFEPEPPAWRQRGWPIEGGPGKGIERLLARQRRDRRPGLD